ncbi:MAG TPA: hypothetical protein VMI06_01815 [Terriglobia bacterium]|nr:hypothetical protein [Terriglobia bacterium]
MLPVWILAAFLNQGSARNSPLTAAAIMARVAANQDRSNQFRADYIYHQRVHKAVRSTIFVRGRASQRRASGR